MTQESRLVFNTAAEGLYRGLARVTDVAALKRHFRERGLDVDHLPPAFEATVYSAHVQSVSSFVWSGKPESEALRLTGLNYVRGWRATILGTASSAMLRIVGPTRALMRLDRVFRTVDNFTKSTSELLGHNHVRITLNMTLGLDDYWVGILEGGLEVLGVYGSIVVEVPKPPALPYRI